MILHELSDPTAVAHTGGSPELRVHTQQHNALLTGTAVFWVTPTGEAHIVMQALLRAGQVAALVEEVAVFNHDAASGWALLRAVTVEELAAKASKLRAKADELDALAALAEENA